MITTIRCVVLAMALFFTTSLIAQSQPTVGISVIQNKVSEDGSRIGRFAVGTQDSLAGPVTVQVQVAGSATPDVDYIALPSSVTLTPANPIVTLSVTPLQDELVEMDETVIIGIIAGSDYQIGNGGPETAIIRDDDLTDSDISSAILNQDAGDPNRLTRAIASRFGELCASAREDRIEELKARCRAFRRALRTGNLDQIRQVRDALRQVMNEEVATQGQVLAEINTAQIGHIANRISALRAGATGFSVAGLSIQSPDQSIALDQMLSSVTGNADPSNELFGSSRWGGFISGAIGDGDAEGSDLQPGFDFDTWSITGGLDYRFSDHWFGGAAVSFSQLDSDFQLSSGSLNEDGWALEMYLGYAEENWFMDGSIGYGKTDFDQTRGVEYMLSDDGQDFMVSDVLDSSTQSSSLLASLAFGWDFHNESWTWGPRFRADYANSDIDPFAEQSRQGSNAFAVQVDQQEVDSLLYRAGLAMYGAFSQNWGVLQPQAEIYFNHEAGNSSRGIRTRFPGAGVGGPIFIIPTDDIDQNYGTFAVGLVALYPQGRQLYVNYYRIFAQSAYNQQILQFGGRIEF